MLDRCQQRDIGCLQLPGNLCHTRCLEQRLERHFLAQVMADPRQQLHRQERVSAQIKEVVVPSYPLHAQQLLPDRCQRSLRLSLRRLVGVRDQCIRFRRR